mmetsp:Transcript_4655/g.10861  ORF Transcript_4655/g.10861 Transcript_4655/m.10861 type:complete len:294 (+) Transcript_4655:693-1574(+)
MASLLRRSPPCLMQRLMLPSLDSQILLLLMRLMLQMLLLRRPCGMTKTRPLRRILRMTRSMIARTEVELAKIVAAIGGTAVATRRIRIRIRTRIRTRIGARVATGSAVGIVIAETVAETARIAAAIATEGTGAAPERSAAGLETESVAAETEAVIARSVTEETGVEAGVVAAGVGEAEAAGVAAAAPKRGEMRRAAPSHRSRCHRERERLLHLLLPRRLLRTISALATGCAPSATSTTTSRRRSAHSARLHSPQEEAPMQVEVEVEKSHPKRASARSPSGMTRATAVARSPTG